MQETRNRSPQQTVLAMIGVYLVVHVLIVAKNLLIPLVLAFFFWFLITSLRYALEQLRFGTWQMSRRLAFALALGLIVLCGVFLGQMISDNVSQVARAAPDYQINVEKRFADLTASSEASWVDELNRQLGKIDLADLIGRSALTLTNMLGDAGLISVYLLFLFVEEKFFDRKLDAMFRDPQRCLEVRALLDRIGRDTRAYIGLKTAVSVMTALPSYAIMAWVGLDYAEFWAVLIFVFNFIPNIGSLTATLLPSLLALVQFDGWRPFVIVSVGVMSAQLLVANLIEPRLMARSLNLSPLVIILSLVVWGSIWGIAGMFLCVPLMVVLMIVLSHFPQTRPIAVLLSEDGSVRETIEPTVEIRAVETS